MDNFSHTLAGLTVGELASERTPATPARRRLLLVASIIANNFPDLDILYSSIVPAPLGYLLHHRGHTHTVVGAIPQTLLILAILWLIPPFRRTLREPGTLRLTSAVIVIGMLMHMLMDSWNSYGVHPFWPFWSGWIYGDAVFIMEPMIWIGFTVPLFFTLKTRFFRYLLLLLAFGVPVGAWHQGLLGVDSLIGLACGGGALALLCRVTPLKIRRLAFGFAFVGVAVFTQAQASKILRDRITERSSTKSPGSRLLEIVTSPTPANPFCWNTIQVEVDPVLGVYRVHSSPESLLESPEAAEACALRSASPAKDYELPLATLKTALAQDCMLEAWLRFARVPALIDGAAMDFRFSSGLRGNFSLLEGAGTARPCPPYLPGWSHPRQDLIDSL